MLGTNQSGGALGSSTGLGSEQPPSLWAVLCVCPWTVMSPACFFYKPLLCLQTTCISSVQLQVLVFWALISPFLSPFIAQLRCGSGRATLCAVSALQQPASCPADVQGQLTGDNLELLGKTQGAWQSPIMSLLGRCCSCQAEENYIQAQRCVFSFGP